MDALPQSPAQAAQFVWWASLAIGVVVAGVVSLLLWLIHRTAATIDARVSTLWDVGQRVAGNTVHIPTLVGIDEAVNKILTVAGRIDAGTVVIESHTRGCPGCPQCLCR